MLPTWALLTFKPWTFAEAVLKLADDGQLSYSYELGMNFRDRKGDHVESFECGHARTSESKRDDTDVRCKGDGCEGGDGVVIALAPDSKAILVKIDSVYLRKADKPKDPTVRINRIDGRGLKDAAPKQGSQGAPPQKVDVPAEGGDGWQETVGPQWTWTAGKAAADRTVQVQFQREPALVPGDGALQAFSGGRCVTEGEQ